MKRKNILFLLICLFTLIFSGCGNQPQTAAIPFVKINNSIFILDSTGIITTELSNVYAEIGAITENVTTVDGAPNESSSCCKIGEKIYQSSANTDEIFVYTKLFSDNDEYRYIKFNKA